MSDYTKPLPIINEDNAPYWQYARRHELRMQQCAGCGHIRFPVSVLCPHCLSMEFQWTRLSGRGTLYSYVVYHHAYHPSYAADLPYIVAIIQLAEGPRMESNLVECNAADLRLDMPVEVIFDDVTEEVTLPKFRLCS